MARVQITNITLFPLLPFLSGVYAQSGNRASSSGLNGGAIAGIIVGQSDASIYSNWNLTQIVTIYISDRCIYTHCYIGNVRYETSTF